MNTKIKEEIFQEYSARKQEKTVAPRSLSKRIVDIFANTSGPPGRTFHNSIYSTNVDSKNTIQTERVYWWGNERQDFDERRGYLFLYWQHGFGSVQR